LTINILIDVVGAAVIHRICDHKISCSMLICSPHLVALVEKSFYYRACCVSESYSHRLWCSCS